MTEASRLPARCGERGGVPRPQDGAPPTSVDVLAAQVRAAIGAAGITAMNGVETRYGRAVAALGALVARVTEAERRAKTAEEWARVMEHERDYEQEVVSRDLSEKLADARNALERIAEQQPETLAKLQRHGVVFDDLGADPTNWQHVAFTIYNDVCRTDSVAREVLDRLDGNQP